MAWPPPFGKKRNTKKTFRPDADILKVSLIYPDAVNPSSKSSSYLIIWQMLKKTCAVLSESTATNILFLRVFTAFTRWVRKKKKLVNSPIRKLFFFFFNPPHPSPPHRYSSGTQLLIERRRLRPPESGTVNQNGPRVRWVSASAVSRPSILSFKCLSSS